MSNYHATLFVVDLYQSIKVIIFVRPLPPLSVSNIGSVFFFFSIISLAQELMSDTKGSEANPAGYVLIGKAGLSRPLGIKPVRSRSLNISLVPYYVKGRTRSIISDVASSLI